MRTANDVQKKHENLRTYFGRENGRGGMASKMWGSCKRAFQVELAMVQFIEMAERSYWGKTQFQILSHHYKVMTAASPHHLVYILHHEEPKNHLLKILLLKLQRQLLTKFQIFNPSKHLPHPPRKQDIQMMSILGSCLLESFKKSQRERRRRISSWRSK